MTPALFIYSEIGEGFGSNPVLALNIAAELSKIEKAGHKAVDVFVNSPGGEVFSAISVHNLLVRSKLEVTMHVDGLAASAASVVLMAGDRIIAAPSSVVMVHQAWTVAAGNADEFDHAARELRTVDEAIAKIFVERTGQPIEKIRQLLSAETWMSAEDAKALGFVDEIVSADEDGDAQDSVIRTRPTDTPAMRAARARISENTKSIAARLPLRED